MKPSTIFRNKDGKLEDSRNGLLYGSSEWQEQIAEDSLDRMIARITPKLKERKNQPSE